MPNMLAQATSSIDVDTAKVAAWVATGVIALLGYTLQSIWTSREKAFADLSKVVDDLKTRMTRVETRLEKE